MLVLAYHAANISGVTSSGPLALFAAELKAGVAVFFLISGFLLYLPFARAIGVGANLPNWRRYAGRRAVRILPGYWAALALLALAGPPKGMTIAHVWQYVTLVQMYHHPPVESGWVVWSLSVEATFYLVLPIFAWIAARTTLGSKRFGFEPQLVLIAGLALGSLLFRAMLTRSFITPVGNGRLTLATALPGVIDLFALGMGLAVLRAAIELGQTVSRGLTVLAGRPGLSWLIAMALYLVGVPAQRGEFFLTAYGVAAHVAIGLAAFFVVLPVVPPRQQSANRFVMPLLCSGVLAWLGTVSYGIYLWHLPFLEAIDAAVGQPRGALAFVGLLLITAVGAVGLGAASWYLIERPAHRILAPGSIGIPAALRKPAGDAA
jgi:peptidoglycan/LPS O-acetylase OafA/YrhL